MILTNDASPIFSLPYSRYDAYFNHVRECKKYYPYSFYVSIFGVCESNRMCLKYPKAYLTQEERDSLRINIYRASRSIPSDIYVTSLTVAYGSRLEGFLDYGQVEFNWYGLNFETEEDKAMFLLKFPVTKYSLNEANEENIRKLIAEDNNNDISELTYVRIREHAA